jgi:hypothetical protein
MCPIRCFAPAPACPFLLAACSLDGRRLYVTNSLLSPWDAQFYPEMVAKGGQLLQVDVDLAAGTMR